MTKHQEVIKYLLTVDQATIGEIYSKVSFGYYCNEHKHLGDLLSTMVKQKKIERVKKGVFRMSQHKKAVVKQNEETRQQLLF